MYDACLSRDPISALNKMSKAGFVPCEQPLVVPNSKEYTSPLWEIMMYKDMKNPG